MHLSLGGSLHSTEVICVWTCPSPQGAGPALTIGTEPYYPSPLCPQSAPAFTYQLINELKALFTSVNL